MIAGAIVISFSVSLACVLAVERFLGHRLLIVPSERSLHVRPTPAGGGVGIVVATLGCVAVLVGGGMLPGSAALPFGAAALLAIVGALDDWRGLAVWTRLLTQVFAAALAVAVWGRSGLLALAPWLSGGAVLLSLLLLLLWLVFMTNAYNFMDGIDGLAGSQAIVAGVGWLWLGVRAGSMPLLLVTIALAFSTAAFMLRNLPPASIFMGDVGSTFLGYLLAALPLFFAFSVPQHERAVAGAVLGVLALWPFWLDAAATIVVRAARREHLLRPHRSHLYQRLVATGMSHLSVTLLYTFLAITGVVAAILHSERLLPVGAVALVPALLGGCLYLLVRRRERRLAWC